MRRGLDEIDEAEAAVRYRAGMSIRRLAEHFGVGHSVIHRALARQHVDMRPHTRPLDADTDVIVELRDSGHTWAEVARVVQMSPAGARKRYEAATACRTST